MLQRIVSVGKHVHANTAALQSNRLIKSVELRRENGRSIVSQSNGKQWNIGAYGRILQKPSFSASKWMMESVQKRTYSTHVEVDPTESEYSFSITSMTEMDTMDYGASLAKLATKGDVILLDGYGLAWHFG